MAKEKKQSVLNGAIVLIAGVLLVKIIGVLFKIPLTDIIGSVGRGYFSSAYEVYTPIFAISRVVVENHSLSFSDFIGLCFIPLLQKTLK